jgi:hypothetical protein
MEKKEKKLVYRPRDSRCLKKLLKKHDPGFCEGQSDIDALYYFTMRNLEEFETLSDARVIDTFLKLRQVIRAMLPENEDFARELKRYHQMFSEHFAHAKLKPKAMRILSPSE